jgi:hypothetical protein
LNELRGRGVERSFSGRFVDFFLNLKSFVKPEKVEYSLVKLFSLANMINEAEAKQKTRHSKQKVIYRDRCFHFSGTFRHLSMQRIHLAVE